MIIGLLACDDGEVLDSAASQAGIAWGDEVACEGGDEGLERFADVGATVLPGFAFGDTTDVFGLAAPGLSPMAVGDTDADGDYDLVLGDFGLTPTVFRNDGGLVFTPVSMVPAVDTTPAEEGTLAPLALALADRDGDGLPEL